MYVVMLEKTLTWILRKQTNVYPFLDTKINTRYT